MWLEPQNSAPPAASDCPVEDTPTVETVQERAQKYGERWTEDRARAHR
jgi:hypothetical protein